MTDWMMDTMVSMTLLMALVLMIRKPVQHFFGAHITYLLWALPLARLFMPTLTLKAPPPEPTAEAVAAVPALYESPLSGLAAAAPVEQFSFGALASVDWLMILLVVWLGGAGMLFISKLAAYFQFREDIVADGRLVGRHGNIKILETAAVGGPLAFGLFKKYIAVPTNFFRDFAPRERELALEHEIAHHESGDLAANFIGLLILSLHWFNPVAWYAWVAFRQDQEAACDARILQKGGREVRAVYGRTIAKSVSGHKLGLASPLNQKNKIKSRLKLLGQSQKSAFRKRLGALMVGASTVVALPLTATITYAEEAEAHPHDAEDHASSGTAIDVGGRDGVKIRTGGQTIDVGRNGVVIAKKVADGYKYRVENDRGSFEFRSEKKLGDKAIAKRLSKIAPKPEKIGAPVPPVAPVAPVPPVPPQPESWDNNVNITMLNGEKNWEKVRKEGREHVYRVKHNGRTVVLRTNKVLSEKQVEKMVEEAEESRLEAEEARREARESVREARMEKEQWRREMRQVEREVEQARREADRESRAAVREAMLEAREAQREAVREALEAQREAREADREAREAQREAKSVAARIWEVSQIAFKPNFRVKVSKAKPDCVAMNKAIAFGGPQQDVTQSQAFAVVAGCKETKFNPNHIGHVDQKALLRVALEGLEKTRAKAAECKSKDAEHLRKLKVYDRNIKELKAQLSMT